MHRSGIKLKVSVYLTAQILDMFILDTFSY